MCLGIIPILSMSVDKDLKSFAATRSYKDFQKDLEVGRKTFRKAKGEYESASAELQALQVKVEKAQREMTDARRTVWEMSNHIQTMDLTGANAVRDRNNSCTYLVDGKEFHADKDDKGHVNLVSWKDYRKQQKEDDAAESDANDAADAYRAAFDALEL